MIRALATLAVLAAACNDPPRQPEKPKKAEKVEPVRVDFDGLEYRILDLPIPTADLENLQAGDSGQVFFIRTADAKRALQRFDLKDRKTETLLPDVAAYETEGFDVVITDSVFEGNEADYEGGGMEFAGWTPGAGMTISGTTFMYRALA